jgi:hypothetical protein
MSDPAASSQRGADEASSPDPFEEPKLLLDGARENIQELEARGQAFVESCRGVPIVDLDAKTDEKVLKYRITRKVPGRLRVVASNALNNLRHSLDQAVNSASVELGSRKRNNYFPFAKDAGEIDGVIRRNCPTVPSGLIRLLKAFQPYGGGDDLLYTMSRMSGPNKHQLVLKLDLNLPYLSMYLDELASFRFSGPFKVGYMGWDSAKQELEFARVRADAAFEYRDDLHLPLLISLADSQTASGEPAAAFLNTLAGKVDRIIQAIEAETGRLRGAEIVRDLPA